MLSYATLLHDFTNPVGVCRKKLVGGFRELFSGSHSHRGFSPVLKAYPKSKKPF